MMSTLIIVSVVILLSLGFHFFYLRSFSALLKLGLGYLFFITLLWAWNFFLPMDMLQKGYLGQQLLIFVPLISRAQRLDTSRGHLIVTGIYFSIATLVFVNIIYTFIYAKFFIFAHIALLSTIVLSSLFELFLVSRLRLSTEKGSVFFTLLHERIFFISSLCFILVMNTVNSDMMIYAVLLFAYFFMFGVWIWVSFQKFRLQTIRLLVQSMVYLVLFLFPLVGGYLLISSSTFLQLSSLSKMLVTLFIPGIIAVLTKGSDLVRIYLNSLSLFTIFMIVPFKQLLDRLYRCVSFTELNQVFYDIQIFKSKSARIFIWHIQSSAPVSITSETPLLPNDVIMILQYRERVFRYQLEPLIQSFKGTPLQTNIDALVTFMDEHDILAVSLLQQSGEMVGVMAIRTSAKYRDILENDIYMLRQLEDGLTACIINLESMERLSSHQMILEDVNAALSFMDLSTEKTEFQEQVSMSLLKVVPTMKSFILLSYDPLSGFYKNSSLFKTQSAESLILHSDDVLAQLNDNILCKFFIDDPKTPQVLYDHMQTIDVKQAILVRLDDGDLSSIFIAFFTFPTDLSDSRVSYCQMLLRQFETFSDYQNKFEKLSELQQFLTDLLDQLPTGILILNSDSRFVFINRKFRLQLQDVNFTEAVGIGVLPPQLQVAIHDVDRTNGTYLNKVQLSKNESADWYLLSGFHVFQENDKHIVLTLTNIQQSKELIDQMNQTNRLAMMSKIAKGISHELRGPVSQLVQGVKNVKDHWQDEQFQEQFSKVTIPQVDRINLLCQSLLRLSRTNVEALVDVYLPDLLDQVLRLIAGDLQYSQHKFYVVYLEKKTLVIDQVMAIQVLMNLMIYTLNFLAKGTSKLLLEIRVTDDGMLFLKVSTQDYCTSTFVYSNQLKDQLELSIVNQIVINQNGRFDIEAIENLVTFNVYLPIQSIQEPIKTGESTLLA
ncbi:MAG: hypothetical protein ACON35_04745 [Candidatus Marinamargulisbacteria bacterium]